MECLQDYHWPGNVRELKNIIEHAVIVCSGNTISPKHLNLNLNKNLNLHNSPTLELNRIIEYVESTIIKRALEKASNNKTMAIKYLGISRGAFYAKLKKYNLT